VSANNTNQFHHCQLTAHRQFHQCPRNISWHSQNDTKRSSFQSSIQDLVTFFIWNNVLCTLAAL